MVITEVHTAHSFYEFDVENNKVRRLASTHEATYNQGPDAQWKEYETLEYMGDGSLMIVWGKDGDIIRRTRTSVVVAMQEKEVDDEEAVSLGGAERPPVEGEG